MNYAKNLDLAKEAKRDMTTDQRHSFDNYLIGVLSDRIPEDEWKDAIRVALSCFEDREKS